MKLSNEREHRRKRVIPFWAKETDGTRLVILTRARRSGRETTSESRVGRTGHHRGMRPHTEARRPRLGLTNIRNALPITVRETTYGTTRPMRGRETHRIHLDCPRRSRRGRSGRRNRTRRAGRRGRVSPSTGLVERDSPRASERLRDRCKWGNSCEGLSTPGTGSGGSLHRRNPTRSGRASRHRGDWHYSRNTGPQPRPSTGNSPSQQGVTPNATARVTGRGQPH